MTNTKKSPQVSSNINPVVAAMAGAVVAGVTVAATMVMSSKDNQNKIKDIVSDVKADIGNKRATIASKVNKLGDIATDAVTDVKSI